ncbi:MAG: mycofactocin biosynthesis peptidyl-dipeptidase MftE [Actinomycetota bacterium]|nr:mycofactocin biosynthesis peptidyl-dipeptidase MftE [Actinomycetota bacterium]MDA2970717.1 mycofactocin biosynthesis peptidyl-dipeptidase MftE [Actinomycetota bacterium]MDA3000671.1 mycofactocin biosynthesis peptidyl-dipeptidase MftE [Actinomycetota bacterium]
MTSAEVAALAAPILLVPVGSFEQHGPHLPLDTDTLIAVQLAWEAQRRLDLDSMIGPPITVSASGEHQGFAGTLSIGTETTAAVLVEIVRSAEWARGVVFVNGHGGNVAAFDRAGAVFTSEGRNVLVWSPSAAPDDDAHAGRTETSVIAHLHPHTVDWSAVAPGNTSPLVDLLPSMRAGGVRAVSDSGVLGDPTGSSAELGARIFERWCDDLVSAVVVWSAHR